MTPAAAQAFMLASVLMTTLPACVLGAMLPVFLCARLMLGDTDAAVAFTIEYHRAAARQACAVLLWVGEVSRAWFAEPTDGARHGAEDRRLY